MHSVLDNAHVVSDYLEADMRWGTYTCGFGPLAPDVVPGMHINQFGVIPEPHQLGKWRLIVDLSHPEGKKSVSDGISFELCTLQ